MITLYGKTDCPYTAKAIAALDAHGLSFIKKNIADDEVANELIALGGKRQVPYIVDGDVQMYESDEIIAYIEKTYAGKEVGIHDEKPHVHITKVGGACSSTSTT